MLTPAHGTFDPSRHLRAGDIAFYSGDPPYRARRPSVPDTHGRQHQAIQDGLVQVGRLAHPRHHRGEHMPSDQQLGVVSALHTQANRTGLLGHALHDHAPDATVRLSPSDGELYGLHSFRVGGAQALALAGRTYEYIMSRGRWSSIESVLRYVETPLDIKISDAAAMANPQAARTASTGHSNIHMDQHTH